MRTYKRGRQWYVLTDDGRRLSLWTDDEVDAICYKVYAKFSPSYQRKSAEALDIVTGPAIRRKA